MAALFQSSRGALARVRILTRPWIKFVGSGKHYRLNPVSNVAFANPLVSVRL
jgi:hypothetical protein